MSSVRNGSIAATTEASVTAIALEEEDDDGIDAWTVGDGAGLFVP